MTDCTEVAVLHNLPPVNQKQITGKLKNPCDSLLTEDSEGVKEQKSKLESEKVQLSQETPTNSKTETVDTSTCNRLHQQTGGDRR